MEQENGATPAKDKDEVKRVRRLVRGAGRRGRGEEDGAGGGALPERHVSEPPTASQGLELVAPPAGGPPIVLGVLGNLAAAAFRLRSLAFGPSLRPLPPSFEDTRLGNAVVAASFPGPASPAGIATVGPVLGVRLLGLNGAPSASSGLSLLRPRLRLHLVDLSTGRYLQTEHAVRPPGGAPVPSVPAAPGSGDRPATATVCATSGACLNRSVPGDALLLAAAAAQAERKGAGAAGRPGGAAAAAASASATTSSASGGDNSAGLFVWGETLAFGAPLAEVLGNPNAAVFLELFEDEVAMGEGDGSAGSAAGSGRDTRVAWGYVRCGSLGGDGAHYSALDCLARSRLPLGFPPGADPPPSAYAQHSPRLVQLYAQRALPLGARSAHLASLPPTSPAGAAQPSPSVFLQYRLSQWESLPFTLEVGLFGALLPEARYLARTPGGLALHYPRSVAAAVAGEDGVYAQAVVPSTPYVVSVGSGALALHPLLGRPRAVLALPCDAPGAPPLQALGDAAAAAAAAAEAEAAAAAAARGEGGEEEDGADRGDDGGLPDVRRDAVTRLSRPRPYQSSSGGLFGATSSAFGASSSSSSSSSMEHGASAPTAIRGALPAGSLGASTLAFSPDGALLAVACVGVSAGAPSPHAIRVYDAACGSEACAPLEGHSGLVNALEWSPDGAWLLSASSDGTALVWCLPRHPALPGALTEAPARPHARLTHPQLSYVYAARFHPTLPCLVVTAAYDGALRLWDALLDVAAAPGRGGGGGGGVGALAGSAGAEGGVLEGRCNGCIGGGGGGGGSEEELGWYTNCAEWEGVGQGEGGGPRSLVTGDSRGVLRFYACPPAGAAHRADRYALAKELRPTALRGEAIVSLRARPPARHRLEASHLLVLSQAARLLMLDGTTFQAVRSFSGVACASRRVEACFSPDGALVAAGSEAGALCLWDAETGAPLAATASVAGVDEGGRIVAGGGRAAIGYPGLLPSVAWSAQGGLAICGFGAEYNVLCVA